MRTRGLEFSCGLLGSDACPFHFGVACVSRDVVGFVVTFFFAPWGLSLFNLSVFLFVGRRPLTCFHELGDGHLAKAKAHPGRFLCGGWRRLSCIGVLLSRSCPTAAVFSMGVSSLKGFRGSIRVWPVTMLNRIGRPRNCEREDGKQWLAGWPVPSPRQP